jgi:hypothetical protein
VLKIAESLRNTGQVISKRNPRLELNKLEAIKRRLERALADARLYGVTADTKEHKYQSFRRPIVSNKSALARYAHGWDSYTYLNTAVDLRLVRGFSLLLQSERERRAPYIRHSQQLVFPKDDPESDAAEQALEDICDEDPPLSGYPLDVE